MSRLVNMTRMLKVAKEEGYAVAQFNINNLEWTQALLRAGEEAQSPIILGVSEGAGRYMGGATVVSAMVNALMEAMNITIPVALHLDHGSSVEVCKEYIDAGFTSVMLDLSSKPIDENIAASREVVEYAHDRGASVEAEVGIVGGEEDGVVGNVQYADLDECVRMVKEAGIDALAAALGSIHGPITGEPKLGFTEMKEISEATQAPLVLHGGSGIPEHQIKKAIERGHAKINVNTELQQQWAKGVRDTLDNDAKIYDPRKVMKSGFDKITAEALDVMEMFGSVNKA